MIGELITFFAKLRKKVTFQLIIFQALGAVKAGKQNGLIRVLLASRELAYRAVQ